uniref:CiBf-3 complement factor B-3 n=1 Tax=Phallusia mammillata TaxID=59560 RepID=A0A6F9D7U8_9ASCI|nr:CiBf-3 complement factor B-3 precursor [Phallusia mammillata]
MKTLCIIVLSLFCRSVSIVRPGSSQTICPSRDLNLIESGRNCRKPCSSDSDCRGRFKRCRCDDVCGMSCFNPNAECARLPVISFGRVIYRSRKYGSQVKYRCNPGWVLKGNAVRTCRSDKKWSGTAARCLILRCNEPEAPNHGSVATEGVDFNYGSRVDFACDPGYENIGSASAICNKRATWEGMANCTGIKLKCGQTVNHISASPSRFVGRVVGGINADRSWPWQALIMVKHGTVYDSFASSFAGGTLINQHWVLTAAHIFDLYSNIENCTTSFVVAVGIVRRPDRRSNIDSNVIVFQPRNIIVHERFDRSDRYERSNYDYDVALIRVGIELSTIKENGLWIWTDSPPKFNGTIPLSTHVNPICLPCSNSCIPIENYMFRNGSRLINENDSEGVKCLKKGKWLANHFTEDRAPVFVTGFGFTNLTRRTMPFKLQQATQRIQPDSICKIAANKIVHETLLDVRYTDRMICARSETSAVSDACQGDSGGPLMQKYKIPNTSESCWIQVGIVSFGYKCGQVDRNTGFRFPGFYTDVSKVQSWIDSTIDGIKCPSFVVENGRLVPQRSVYAHGSTVTIECNTGYQLNGTSSQTCTEDGLWVNDQPRCIDPKCPSFPRSIDNGEIRITYPRESQENHLPGTRVSYICQDGYKINNTRYQTSVTYTCLTTKQWNANPSTVSCVKKTCPPLRRIINGQMNPVFQERLRHPVGTVVSFTCSSGYRLTKTRPLRCRDSESWSRTQPSCRGNML